MQLVRLHRLAQRMPAALHCQALRFAEGSNDGRIEWVSDDAGQITVLHEEPDSGFWDRTMLELLAPLTPESLL